MKDSDKGPPSILLALCMVSALFWGIYSAPAYGEEPPEEKPRSDWIVGSVYAGLGSYCRSLESMNALAAIEVSMGPKTAGEVLQLTPDCERSVIEFRVQKLVGVHGKGKSLMHVVEIITLEGETLYIATSSRVVQNPLRLTHSGPSGPFFVIFKYISTRSSVG